MKRFLAVDLSEIEENGCADSVDEILKKFSKDKSDFAVLEIVKIVTHPAVVSEPEWAVEQPVPAEQGAEWEPKVGETVEVRGLWRADNDDSDNWRMAKITDIRYRGGQNHRVEFVDGPNARDIARRCVEDGDMRRPTKQAEKPFVFGERVLCGVTFSGVDCGWHPGVVVKFKPNDRVCVWPEGSADWFVFEKNQLKYIE